MSDAAVGIIGGSGLYEMQGLTVLEERTMATPFGDPSDAFVIGELDGVRVAFLSRHGRGEEAQQIVNEFSQKYPELRAEMERLRASSVWLLRAN